LHLVMSFDPGERCCELAVSTYLPRAGLGSKPRESTPKSFGPDSVCDVDFLPCAVTL